jgi:hypothetical protein
MADDDVLSVGGDPAPPSHAPKIVLVLALIAFGGWRLTDRARGGADAAPSPSASAAATPSPTVTPAAVESPAPSPRPTRDHHHVSIGAPTTARLLLGGPFAMDAPAGRQPESDGLTVDGAVTQVVHADSGDFVLDRPR